MSKKKQKKKTKSNRTKKQVKKELPQVRGWFLLTASLMMLISLLSFAYGPDNKNWLGLIGYGIGWIQAALFGIPAYLAALFIGWVGCRKMFNRPIERFGGILAATTVLIFSLGVLLSLVEIESPPMAEALRKTFFKEPWREKLYFHPGGAPAYYLLKDMPGLNLARTFNSLGVLFLFSAASIGSIFYLLQVHPSEILSRLERARAWLARKKPEVSMETLAAPLRFVKLMIPESQNQGRQDMLEIQPERELRERPSLSRKQFTQMKERVKVERKENIPAPSPAVEEAPPPPPPPAPKKSRRETALAEQRIINGDFAGFKVPSTTYLTSPKKLDQSTLKKDLRRYAEVLEETLLSFGIEAKVGQINCGPTITSFEVHPAIGVKVQKIKALESDIALNMEAKSIRILAPIPGKAAIGIEVPNLNPQEVSFKEMLNAYQQKGKPFHIPVLLGKTVSGEYVMNDLAKMPHLIIAGATGSGKSVCINTIVMSILMNAKPDEIKLIMVDPKKVELTPYSKLPHMLAPVITEPAGACAALHWLVKEMESRYEILKHVGFRNIASFNNRTVNREFEESLGREIPERMHYIVAIIDELADLMMVSSHDMENYIARIAQMARAVGIHLILATQRPSREVITGLIKANFPTRIAFKVSSRVNSQIILDEVGAETLLGNGDMLFLPPASSHLVRAQGAFIRDEDINKVVESICRQAPPNYVIESFDNLDSMEGLSADGEYMPADPLYEQAYNIVLDTGNASTTFLQRKLKVGYARAASLIDELEAQGVLGPSDGSKPRKILKENES